MYTDFYEKKWQFFTDNDMPDFNLMFVYNLAESVFYDLNELKKQLSRFICIASVPKTSHKVSCF